MFTRATLFALTTLILSGAGLGAQDAELREQAAKGLRKAVAFFRTQVSTEGGYLWRYSDDLKRREGEGKAGATRVWVQPPGSPSVGLALLFAYEATGDEYYLKTATDCGHALVRGQLNSGGWDYVIEFDPKLRPKFAYRSDSAKAGSNVSTLDDNNTQEAVRLLLRLDHVVKQKDARIHEAVTYALEKLIEAQYPNGAWPQRFSEAADPVKFPVKKASYPDTWSRTYPAADYRSHYTFNDNSIADVVDVLLLAHQLTGQEKYRQAALKAGDFILLAQMPEPQPGWAQQYNAAMQPAWARKFEPPSITGGEAQSVMLLLLRLYRETADKKYLEPLPRALAYYQKSLLPDGKLARFYELKTNKPLFVNKDYQLSYEDKDLITHYGLKISSKLDRIAKELETVRKLDPAKLNPKPAARKPEVGDALRAKVRSNLKDLDDQGRWVEPGKLRSQGPDDPTTRIITTQTFITRVRDLSQFLAATRP